MVHPIKTLVRGKIICKTMIDVVGKFFRGGRIRLGGFVMRGGCELFLKDGKGDIIKLIVHDTLNISVGRIVVAIREKSILFASRVNLIHENSINTLIATDLTNIKYEPLVLEVAKIEYRMLC